MFFFQKKVKHKVSRLRKIFRYFVHRILSESLPFRAAATDTEDASKTRLNAVSQKYSTFSKINLQSRVGAIFEIKNALYKIS